MQDNKMLQIILDGQTKIREDIKGVEKKLSTEIRKNGERIDKLGKQPAYLEDDAPTNEDFDNLDTRVKKIEKVIISV